MLGLSESAEKRRIENNEVIQEALVNIPLSKSMAWRRPALPGLFGWGNETSRSNGKVACLNVKVLPYWIALIDHHRIRPELQQSICPINVTGWMPPGRVFDRYFRL